MPHKNSTSQSKAHHEFIEGRQPASRRAYTKPGSYGQDQSIHDIEQTIGVAGGVRFQQCGGGSRIIKKSLGD